MGGTFVVTLREGFEAALIMGIVYTYLQKIGAERHYGYATRGGLLGVLASVALGLGRRHRSDPRPRGGGHARVGHLSGRPAHQPAAILRDHLGVPAPPGRR